MGTHALSRHLKAAAQELRPPSGAWVTPVLGIAKRLGLQVSLQLHRRQRGQRRLDGELVLSPRPEVIVYREGTQEITRMLAQHDELLLRVRERFTVAHELGHWIAFKDCGCYPVDPEAGCKSVYWQQEQAVDQFAQTLLLPDWLLSYWLDRRRSSRPVGVYDLNRWALDARTSREVIACRIAERQSCLGFLKLALDLGGKNGRPTFRVLHAAAGLGIELPKMHKKFSHDRMTKLITTSRHGQALMRGTSFDERTIQDLYLSWWREPDLAVRQSGVGGAGGAVFWTTWAKADFTNRICDRETSEPDGRASDSAS